MKFISTAAVELGVLVINLELAHTLSKHDRDALLNESQHTYICIWRVYGKGTKPYWYPNMAV